LEGRVDKSIDVALNSFDTTPHSLRAEPAIDAPRSDVAFDVASLYHHYYFDKHGKAPPNPDPAQFEQLQYFTPDNHFRISGDGLGFTTAARRNMSSELGHAFCRKFLHDHVDIVYFAHIEHVLRRSVLTGFGGLTVRRAPITGDAPDYFCAESVDKIFLAEAKGRHEAIGFQKKDFGEWRKQFSRIIVQDGSGAPRKMKGFIVATRFAVESKPKTRSCIYAEDPDSPGEIPLTRDESPSFGEAVIAMHYSDVAWKLNQPILAQALALGFRVPREIQFPATVWELQFGPLAKRRYVGGYYPYGDLPVRIRQNEGRISFTPDDPFRLDVGRATFLGLEERIFKQVVGIARDGTRSATEISKADQIIPFYSGMSMLKDGSVLGLLDFFTPVAQIIF
jgi:hypothetical protein